MTIMWSLFYLGVSLHLHGTSAMTMSTIGSTRREILGRTITTTFGGIATSSGWITPDTAVADDDASFSSYQIFPDSSANLDPLLKKVAPSDLMQIFAMTDNNSNEGGALWLGEHHNSAQDHQLQADFVRNIYKQRLNRHIDKNGNMAVGLEMVQLRFQPVLDKYIAKKISSKEMKSQVQWDKRWSWSFDNYLPIFETCRDLNIPLIALNVDSEDLSLVEIGGYPNLPPDRMQRYISDPSGFAGECCLLLNCVLLHKWSSYPYPNSVVCRVCHQTLLQNICGLHHQSKL